MLLTNIFSFVDSLAGDLISALPCLIAMLFNEINYILGVLI
jgi:hypothetical protein